MDLINCWKCGSSRIGVRAFSDAVKCLDCELWAATHENWNAQITLPKKPLPNEAKERSEG